MAASVIRSLCFLVVVMASLVPMTAPANEKNAYFGDLHIHTRLSYDAFFFGTATGPDDAYQFAKGGVLRHPAGIDLQLDRPLDFYAVTDHAYYLGQWWSVKTNANHPLADDPEAQSIVRAKTVAERGAAFRRAFRFPYEKFVAADMRSAWREVQEAAERHNEPGKFTTFIGFEFTPEPNMDGLHRNVIYKTSVVPPLVIGRMETLNPEFLWNWMERHRAAGADAIAIPHNMNLSGGRMFEGTTFLGAPLTPEYAELRMRNEPLVEITQVKGTSDTHPYLSPNDEWADFEIAPFKLGGFNLSNPRGSYVRDALKRGLEFADRDGFNPYKFGFIGSSDTHNSGQNYDEDRYVSKVGDFSARAVARGSVPTASGGYLATSRRYYSAAGLAGIWSHENSRPELFEALRRKETFATSGPRIKARLEVEHGDRRHPQGSSVTMGRGDSPVFDAWAIADAHSAKLQRLQIIKGSIVNGRTVEHVFDVACSAGAPDPDSHRCEDNGAAVDLRDCSVTQGVGAGELRTQWRDPTYRRGERAFYYVRALENPTCRWSTWDAIRAGVAPRPDLPATIQERAWTSPVWIEGSR